MKIMIIELPDNVGGGRFAKDIYHFKFCFIYFFFIYITWASSSCVKGVRNCVRPSVHFNANHSAEKHDSFSKFYNLLSLFLDGVPGSLRSHSVSCAVLAVSSVDF